MKVIQFPTKQEIKNRKEQKNEKNNQDNPFLDAYNHLKKMNIISK
ncbi:hypothetical protein ICU_05132 [Bacillus cereus BAG2X1-1]|nr:hypothetical protein ICU_05132 [Bacillus cereus BAG2X1-1]